MEISLSRFIQLTALIASSGTLVTACTINNVQDDSDAGSSLNAGTGGVTNTGGASSTSAGASSAGSSNVATGGTTGTSVAGATSTAGAAPTGGAGGNSAAGNSSTSIAGSTATGGASTAIAGSTSTSTGGIAATGGASASTSTGGKAATGGASASTSTGGKASTGGATASTSTGGKAATGGASATGGSTSCVAGDPVSEGGSFDCYSLSYANEECDDPSGEGTAPPYGVAVCEDYSSDRTGSVKVLTDCLSKLTAPSSGWCGAEHQTAVEACRSQMEAATCPSSAAQTTCANVHAACPSITTASCVADLSPFSDANVAFVDTCMEGASLASSLCGALYQTCAGFVTITMSVTDACNQIVQGCTGVTNTTCQGTLDFAETGIVSGALFTGVVTCMASYMMSSTPCDEAFSLCTF